MVVLASGLGIAMLSLANVRERRMEIGLFRAVGVPGWRILAALLGKPVLLGVAGGALGLLIGWGAAVWIGPHWMGLETSDVAVAPDVAWAAVLGTPVAALFASYLPILWAFHQDPAQILREA
jgi:putative ABC transport system permease protein